MSDSQQLESQRQGLLQEIRQNLFDADLWGFYADFLQDDYTIEDNRGAIEGKAARAMAELVRNPAANEEQRRSALLDAARKDYLRGWPLEALPVIAELFDLNDSSKYQSKRKNLDYNTRYANYLDIAAAVTRTDRSRLPVSGEGADKHFDASRCTQLQADYLRDWLTEGGRQRALLADIRTELRKIPGLGELPDNRISATVGRITLNASGTGIKALPEGLHITGNAYFMGCGDLEYIRHFHAGFDASFFGCINLTGASHIHAGGDASFFGCGKLETLGEGCRIGQDLYLTRSGVTRLPEDIVIGGEINDIPSSFTTENLRAALDYKDISEAGKANIRAELGRRPKEKTDNNDLVGSKSTLEIT